MSNRKIMEDLQAFLGSRKPDRGFLPNAPHIKCPDGFTMSVQASKYHYCTPRDDYGPWEAVEIGFPSHPIPEALEWRDGPEPDTGNVFACVPLSVVAEIIWKHGGTFEPMRAVA
jgi:hypothetical protein